ncbi:STAS domain-containing protein [Actinoplanes sp. NPDC023801]|uniref:STAS domain-containing protein n=1 Tax=Actinoplanes sp. NPDC023801 TaxID=3154595 RepID=UPI00340D8CE3
MKITTSHDGDRVTRLVVTGDLDMATVPGLDEAVAAALTGNRPHRLVIDLAGLDFCDSAGIHALTRARDSAQRRAAGFVVTNPTGITRRTLEISGLLDLLTTVSGAPEN